MTPTWRLKQPIIAPMANQTNLIHGTINVYEVIAMRLQQAISDDTMTAIAVGDKPPRRNVREIKKRDRLLNATPLYDSKPLLEFLDLIADIWS